MAVTENPLMSPIADYLCKKKNVVRLVIFSTLFAIIFINIYKPFNSSNWISDIKENISLWYLLYSSILVIIGFMVVAVSRIIQYQICKKKPINYLQYILWMIGELFFMSLFFTAICIALNKEFAIVTTDVSAILKNAFVNTLLILWLPYCLCWLFFSWQDKAQRLAVMETDNANATSVDNLGNRRKTLSFYTDKGDLRLTLRTDDLVYIEGADNYVILYYLNNDKICKELLRNSLKTMEVTYREYGIIRCHRSYIVNFSHVKVMRRASQQVVLELDIPGVDALPISKTYYNSVADYFQKGLWI